MSDLASGCAKKLFSSMLVFDEANNRVGQRGLVSAPHCYDSLGCVLLISTFPSDPSLRGCNLHTINIACLDKSAVGPTSSEGSELYNKYPKSIFRVCPIISFPHDPDLKVGAKSI